MAAQGVQHWLVPVMEKDGPRVRTIEMEHTKNARSYKVDGQEWPHSTKTQEGARPILDILKIGNTQISIEIERIGHNLRYEAKINSKSIFLNNQEFEKNFVCWKTRKGEYIILEKENGAIFTDGKKLETSIRCKGDHSMSSFNLGSGRFQMIEQRTEKGAEYTLIRNSMELEIAQFERTGVRISPLQP